MFAVGFQLPGTPVPPRSARNREIILEIE